MKKFLLVLTILTISLTITFAKTQQRKNETVIQNEHEILKLGKQAEHEKNVIKRAKIENTIILKEIEKEISVELQDLNIDTNNITTIQKALKQAKKIEENIPDTIETFKSLITESRIHLITAYNKKSKDAMELEKSEDIFESNRKILQLMTTSLDKFDEKLKWVKKGKYPQKKKAKIESLGQLNNDSFDISIKYKDIPYSLKFSFDSEEKEKAKLMYKKPKHFIVEPVFCINEKLDKELVAFSVKHSETDIIKEIEIRDDKIENSKQIEEIEYYKNLSKTLQEIEKFRFGDFYTLNQKLIQIKSLDILDKNYTKQVKSFLSNIDKIIISATLGNNYHTVLLRANGTVSAYGLNENGQCNVKDWKDIIKIYAGIYNTVGLKRNGTVVVCGWNDGLKDIKNWKNIIDVKAGKTHIVGLRKDGTVVACGDNTYGQCNVGDWKNIVSISVDGNRTAGLRKDGTVVACGDNHLNANNVEYWKDIKDLKIEGASTIGLKKDGTMFACGENYGNVQTWTNIISMSIGRGYVVGLKSNGTVVAVGQNSNGQCNVEDWRNVVSVSAGYAHTVGLKKDGTVVACGWNEHGQCNVNKWKDVISISASAYNTIGLKKDGTVVICGDNSKGQCNIK